MPHVRHALLPLLLLAFSLAPLAAQPPALTPAGEQTPAEQTPADPAPAAQGPAAEPAEEEPGAEKLLPPQVEEPEVRLRLEFDLLDDSRLFAIPRGENPRLRLETRVGEVEVRLAELAYFEMADDHQTITAHWPEGDRLTGLLLTPSLSVETVLGEMEIPLLAVRTCAVQPIPIRAPRTEPNFEFEDAAP